MSEVQSPPGYRISWASAGPSGSFPKSIKKSLFTAIPFTGSTSICRRHEPFLYIHFKIELKLVLNITKSFTLIVPDRIACPMERRGKS
jgi:hypothetical protein